MGYSEMGAVTWEDIGSVDEVFTLWSDGSEVRWAKQAWETLARKGLTSYADEFERYQVLIRLFALGAIYRDFCSIAWEERQEPEYDYWAELVDLSVFRIGQLVGHAPDVADDAGGALADLVENCRGEVVDALHEGFGGTSGLFLALWRTNQPASDDTKRMEGEEASRTKSQVADGATGSPCEDRDSRTDNDAELDEREYETDWEIMNDVDPDKMAAYEWVDERCDSVSYGSDVD